MKLKSYILVGYIISTLLTIIVVFWAIQRMLIEEREIYFLVGMTLVASFVGAGISLFLLSPVFTSLAKLKEHAKRVADKDFPSNLEVQGPVEFQQLGQAFNEMSHDLQATFDSLEESEREKGLMIAQLSHDIKTPITSIQATVEGILDGVIKEGEQDHYLATIGRQTERLNKLVEELNFLTLFTSLAKLKEHAKRVADKDFPSNLEVQGPVEFQQLGQAFNEMSHDLQATFDSLEESEREKGLMIAQLSHDIKTPITSIQATVEGILDGVIKEGEQDHYLATIGRQTERLNKLVEELNFLTLNTARNQAETTSKDSIFLDQLLIECMSEFQFLIEQEERDVHLQVIPESARIEGDYAKLSRILVNLVNNAFKYSAPGTKLEVVAKLENNQLSISVTDEGQGIAPEDLENIFKRLYRVETSRNMKTGGHGLGLAIARELAHQLGGEITVSSQYGLGSTFTLVLDLSGNENKA